MMSEKKMQMETIVVVGGGSIGKRHISNLRKLGRTDLYCLRREYDSRFEDENGVKVITSIEQVGNQKIDAVFICSPTALHLEGIKYAVKLNASVFMEKPLTHSLNDLLEAKSILSTYQRPFFIGFMLRYHPVVKKVKEIIDSRELGKVYSARFEFGSYLPYWHPWEDYKISYASRRDLGGGVINTITHELDLIQFLFGEPISIYTQARNLDKLGVEVEEIAEGILEYNDKIVTLHLDYLQKDYDRNIKILFDDGKIIWNWHENELHILKHKEPLKVYKVPESFQVNDLYIDELKDFLNVVAKNQETHALDFYHAIANTNLMLAMHQSALEGRKVSI